MQTNIGDSRSAQQLYDATAASWVRTAPTSLSDFTARPALLQMCMPLADLHCLDLGCGEGYCSRMLQRGGAAEVLGVDISAAMIKAAREQETHEPLGVHYKCGTATDLQWLADEEFDLVLAVFMFNYLDCDATRACMREVARLLRPGGRFVFAVPHPLFPYVRRPAPPFYFDVGTETYYSGRNHLFHGKICKRDGSELQVQVIHKTFEDYFDALRAAGFTNLPILRELTVTDDIAAIDPPFFTPLLGAPLHVAFSLRR
jgi:SAM-dependent methyltransferase